MKKVLLPFSIVAFFFILQSCGANKDNGNAEKSMNAFYDALVKGDVTLALKNCSSSAFAQGEDSAAWRSAIENNLGLLGKMQSYNKTSGWNINKSTETGTQVSMTYDVVYEYGKSTDSVTMIKDPDGMMRLLNYQWNLRDAKYIENINEAEKISSQYMDAMRTHNYDECYALCGYKALEVTPKEEWLAMLISTNDQTGAVTGYEIDHDQSHCNIASQGGAGAGNYYDIHVNTDTEAGKVSETFNLYQPTYNDPLKIVSHSRE